MINGADVGPLEGMAPAARLSIYKVLYENRAGTTAQGSDADIVAAINDAINDGVDVINFSVGDNVDTFGPEELAFLNAAAPGVFVSAAAGNAGPGATTVDNAMPWETTVAAGTFDQSFPKTVTLGNGATYTGVGRGAARNVLAAHRLRATPGLTGADATAVSCASRAASSIRRRSPARSCSASAASTLASTRASPSSRPAASGMILYNPSDAHELDADFHFVPTVHIDNTDGLAIKAYIALHHEPDRVAERHDRPDQGRGSGRRRLLVGRPVALQRR